MAVFWFMVSFVLFILLLSSSTLYVKEKDKNIKWSIDLWKRKDNKNNNFSKPETFYKKRINELKELVKSNICKANYYQQEMYKQNYNIRYNKKWAMIRRLVIWEIVKKYNIPEKEVLKIIKKLEEWYKWYKEDLKNVK